MAEASILTGLRLQGRKSLDQGNQNAAAYAEYQQHAKGECYETELGITEKVGNGFAGLLGLTHWKLFSLVFLLGYLYSKSPKR